MRFQPANNWTDEQIAELRALAKLHPLPTIVEKLGRPYQQVRYQIRKLGLSTQPLGKRALKDVAEIRKYSDRHGVKAAAEHFGLTKGIVQNARRRYVREMKEIGTEFSAEQVQKLRKAAFYWAVKKGRADLGEDFGSFAVIQRLTHEGINLKFAWGNFMNQTFGDTTNEKGLAQRQSQYRTVEITDSPDFDSPHPGIQVAGDDPREREGQLSFDALANRYSLIDRHRIIFFLHYKWGMGQSEMAEVLDCAQTRVCQLLAEVTLKIRQDLVEPIERAPAPQVKRPPLPPLLNGEKRPRGRPKKVPGGFSSPAGGSKAD